MGPARSLHSDGAKRRSGCALAHPTTAVVGFRSGVAALIKAAGFRTRQVAECSLLIESFIIVELRKVA